MPGDVSRRTLAKGAAWTMPVVAAAGSAPAASASVPPPPACLTKYVSFYVYGGGLEEDYAPALGQPVLNPVHLNDDRYGLAANFGVQVTGGGVAVTPYVGSLATEDHRPQLWFGADRVGSGSILELSFSDPSSIYNTTWRGVKAAQLQLLGLGPGVVARAIPDPVYGWPTLATAVGAHVVKGVDGSLTATTAPSAPTDWDSRFELAMTHEPIVGRNDYDMRWSRLVVQFTVTEAIVHLRFVLVSGFDTSYECADHMH